MSVDNKKQNMHIELYNAKLHYKQISNFLEKHF